MTESSLDLIVLRVQPAVLYDLRRRVLRAGRRDVVVANAADALDDSRHFAGLLDGAPVVSASFFRVEGPEGATYQLRYMATEPGLQGRGYGARVLGVAETVLAREGVTALWANARDSALDFYRRAGWRVLVGTEHLSAETQIPHTVIHKALEVPGE